MSESTRRNIQFSLLVIAGFITTFNVGVTNVALPSIAAALNANGIQIYFIANAFTLFLTAFTLLAGAMADDYGKKLFFILGAAIMAISSIMASLSTTIDLLLVWRITTGIGAAMLFPTSLSIVTTIFPNQKEKVFAIGIWSGAVAVGGPLAAVIVGFLLESFSWGSAFLFSVPFLLVIFLFGWWLLPASSKTHASLDWIGGILSLIFITSLVTAIIFYPVNGLNQITLLLLATFTLSLIGFIFREKHTSLPLLDLSVFRNKVFTIASTGILILAFSQNSVMYLSQQYLQNVLSYQTLTSGLATLPFAILLFIASLLSGKLFQHFGTKLVSCLGFLLIAGGFFSGIFWSTTSSYSYILIFFSLIGIGLGLAVTPLTNAIMHSLPQAKAGIGSAVNGVTRNLGFTLAVAVNGSFIAVRYDTILHNVYNNLPTFQQQQISQNVAETILSSLTGALNVANRYSGVDSEQLVTVAKQAFLRGQVSAMILAVTLSLFITALIFFLFPKKKEI